MKRVDARAPVRLDLAGGWTDVPPYTHDMGGEVVNVAINIHGRALPIPKLLPIAGFTAWLCTGRDSNPAQPPINIKIRKKIKGKLPQSSNS